MQLAVFVLAQALVALLASSPALGADILYATAASQGRIDGFRLGAKGQLDGPPDVQEPTAQNPRRIVAVGCTLYVVESDRLEAFAIDDKGGLKRIARTVVDDHVRLIDMTARADGQALYVAEKGFDRVVAYPLGTNGVPAAGTCSCASDADCHDTLGSCLGGRCVKTACAVDADCNGMAGSCLDGRCTSRSCTLASSADQCADKQTCVIDFTSCALGPAGIQYQSLTTHDLLVLAAGAGFRGGVDAFQTDAAGALPTVPCGPPTGSGRPALTRTTWCRRRISTPRLVVDDMGILYVHDRQRGRLFGFRQLTTSTLLNIEDGEPCTPETASCTCSGKRADQQKADVKTAAVASYEDLLVQGRSLFASEFHRSRVDAYALRPEQTPLMAKHPLRSHEDVRMSPVGMTTAMTVDGDHVLYLAGGELDRVRAYDIRRRSDGTLVQLAFKGQTEEQKGSFPNDVAVAMGFDACPARGSALQTGTTFP